MKFLSIRDGFSVRKECIEAVSRTQDLKCKIYTESNVYKCDFPYQTVLAMLEASENIEEKVSKSRTDELLEQVIKNQQVFVG